jgi:hypothetical protein
MSQPLLDQKHELVRPPAMSNLRVILAVDPDEIKATLKGELGTILGSLALQTANTGKRRWAVRRSRWLRGLATILICS